MAKYYRILSSYSASGENLKIPIYWDFDNIDDLFVLVADSDGEVASCDYWTWNSQLCQVEIENTKNYSAWAAYVSRKEDAATLLELVEGFIVNPQNIVEQFKKVNRVIEALQEEAKTALHAPDYVNGYLPNVNGRKGRFLSFDENGNPSCDIGTDEFNDAHSSTYKAMSAAQEAAENAETSEVMASNHAESAAISASQAAASKTNAEQSKNAANNSALSAQASAELAASLVVNATELGQIKSDKGVLHCFVEGDYSSNKGSIYGVLASQLTFPLSVLWRGKFEFVTTKSTYMLSLGGTGANSDIRITIAQYSDYAVRIQIGTSALIPTFSNPNVIVNALSGGNVDSFGLIITESDGAYMGKFYVNGSLLGESTSTVVPTGFTNSSNYAFNRSRSGALGTSDADYADICIFNFDVSASNAPYTIADYHVGRVIPARLLNVNSSQRALLALENYVFTNGSTKIIPDYSGNLTDASASGSVVGDNDTKIARLTSLINSQVPTA